MKQFEKTQHAHSEMDAIGAIAAFLAVALLALATVLVLAHV